MMRLRFAAFLLSALLPASASWASVPREIVSVIHAQTPYGKGTYSALIITAYDAELWTDAPQWSMQAPFALTLRYHMGFSTDDFVSRAKSEMKHVDPSLTDATLTQYADAMKPAFPAVKEGDEITALYRPGQPVQVFHNGAPTGAIKAKGFATPFFGIWLSPRSTAPSLRAGLLHMK